MVRTWRTWPVAVFLLCLAAASGAAQTPAGFVDLGGHRIEVEVADTLEKKILGLSRRETLPERQGMLFTYSDKALRDIWMKEMRFDLDIVWIDDDRIVKIDRSAKAEGKYPRRIYGSEVPVNRVLEIRAGLTDRWGIRVGDRVRFFRK